MDAWKRYERDAIAAALCTVLNDARRNGLTVAEGHTATGESLFGLLDGDGQDADVAMLHVNRVTDVWEIMKGDGA
jgi:hypothetical protein